MKYRQGTLLFSVEFIELCLTKINKQKVILIKQKFANNLLISKMVAPAVCYKANLFKDSL